MATVTTAGFLKKSEPAVALRSSSEATLDRSEALSKNEALLLARRARKVCLTNRDRQRVVGAWLLLLTSCSSEPGPVAQGEPANPLDVSDVIYVGGATDEALLRLLDATPKDDPRQYVVVDAPAFGAPLPKEMPVTVKFHFASQAARAPVIRTLPAPAASRAWKRHLHELLLLLGPPRVAYAHGSPYNGTGCFLVATDANSTRRLRVFTDRTYYTPEAAVWESLAQAPQPLSLSITSAFFEGNEIPADGGPFIGTTFEFRIE